ncbi:MAG: hypothetical protein ACLP7J_00885 [Streptosporangiaceae bacterium]
MSAGWAAASVRARAMARRRLGPASARSLAACGSLPEALRVLAATPYGQAAGPGLPLAAAQHAVADAIVWDLRVLAGWLPPGGVPLLRALAGWFEIANVDELLERLGGRPAGPAFEMGALTTAWPRLQSAASPAALRAALAASAWQDPGTAEPAGIRLALRARQATRLAALPGRAADWGAGAAALLLAAARFAGADPAVVPGGAGSGTAGPGMAGPGMAGPGSAGAGSAGAGSAAAGDTGLSGVVLAGTRVLLGPAAGAAATLGELVNRLPARARWVLAGVRTAADLWQAEAAWWARVEQDGERLLRGGGLDRGPVLGAAAVLAADARRIRAALELAARGGGPLEAYDAVA